MSLECSDTTFRDRRAIRLQSDSFQVVTTTGCGHLASLRIPDVDVNPLWEPPWPGIEPEDYDPDKHLDVYGPGEGRLLASLTGHSLCLNHFGDLTEAEEEAKGYYHGEASNLPWTVFEQQADETEAKLDYGLELPDAQLRFRRTLRIRPGESTLYISERTTSLKRSDAPFCCQQHVTLGPPFVEGGVSRLDLPARRGQTSPTTVDSSDPLAADQPYTWPNAPLRAGGTLDLRMYPKERCTYGATTLSEPDDEHGFTAVSNPRLGLLLIYVFPREIFPWTSLWFEHEASDFPPYNAKTTTWGVEFGSVAQPVKLIETLTAGPLLGAPRFGTLPARHTIEVTYQAQLLKIPADWQGVKRIEHRGGETVAWETGSNRSVTTPSDWQISTRTSPASSAG
ncbi:MAG: hypothetical protein CME15_00140 [Gemmatimonadetes bacterium]|jgi:hypothetical protein|nr:hypothetical protein [Gemmatimonadota bacterium]